MADQRSRGGKKEGRGRGSQGKKHQGVYTKADQGRRFRGEQDLNTSKARGQKSS